MERPPHTPTGSPAEPATGTRSGSPSGAPGAHVASPARLRRRASRRLVAGVAGGLADHYLTRPIWFRLVFAGSAVYTGGILLAGVANPYHEVDLDSFALGTVAALAALGGTGAYLLLWWLVPREDLSESAAQRLAHRYPSANRWPGLVLLGLGVAFLLAQLGVWRGNVVIAFALIFIGLFLYRRDGERLLSETESRSHGAQALPAAPRAAETGPGLFHHPTGAPVGSPITPIRRRERSPLGWITLGLAMLVLGGSLIWANATDSAPRLVVFPALSLAVISAGLLVGTFFGRARWLVLPALLVTPMVLVSSSIRLPLEGRVGGYELRPGSIADVADSYRATAGQVALDFTRFEGRDVELAVSASTVLGDVWILVPYDAHVMADGYTGYGNVSILEDYDSGVEVSVHTRSEPRWGDGMTLNLTLESGIGSVQVYRDFPTKRERRQLREEARAARLAELEEEEGA